MSCEGSLLETVRDRGQIEADSRTGEESETFFQINVNYKCTEYGQNGELTQDVGSRFMVGQNLSLNSLVPESNDFNSNIELLIGNSENVNVEDWLKTKSGNNVDIDTVLKRESVDTFRLSGSNYVVKDAVNKFTARESSLTNLPLDIPVIFQDSSHTLEVTDVNGSGNEILNDYNESNSILSVFDRTGVLEGDKCDPLNSSVKLVSLPQHSSTATKALKVGSSELKNGKSINIPQELPDSFLERKNKVVWDNFNASKKELVGVYPGKDIDLSELNLFALPVECVLQEESCGGDVDASLPQGNEKLENSNVCGSRNTVISYGWKHSSVGSPVVTTSSSAEGNLLQNNGIDNVNESCSSKHEINSTQKPFRKQPLNLKPGNGNPLLPITSSSSTKLNFSQADVIKSDKIAKTPKMAIIAISTDKTKNTTEIVINTSRGEQVLKGKTTDLLQAASPWNTQGNNTLRCKKIHTVSSVGTVPMQKIVPKLNGDSSLKSAHKYLYQEEAKPGDQIVVQALAEVGISTDELFPITAENDQKIWTCPVKSCNRTFPRLSMLRIHILCHYGIRPYKCDYEGCEWSFYTYFKLKRHKETHLRKKDFMCPMEGCGRRFTTVYNLNTHVKLHQRPAEMVCPVDSCGARFQTKRSMELHMRTHDSLHAPYKCPYEGCGKLYYSSNSLHSHTRVHLHKEEELLCQWEGCGKLFDKPCRLKAHMRTHTGVKPYKCTFKGCTWAFTSASKLKRHQYKHTNERKYRCTLDGCGKSFMRSEHLKEHMLTHISERTFQCPVENCGQRFSAKSSLYVHSKKHNSTKEENEGKIAFCCPIEQCNRTYFVKSSLRQHMLKFHTPVLAQDSSQLDYITLLATDSENGSLEGLEMLVEDQPSLSGETSANPVQLSVPSELSSQSAAPELVSTDFREQNLAASQNGTEGLVTHLILAPVETKLGSTCKVEHETDVTEDRCINMSPIVNNILLGEETVVTSSDHTSGSARTDFTYEDIRLWKKANVNLDTNILSEGNTTPLKLSPGSGLIVSGQGMPSGLLQDDPLSAQDHTYQEDNLMTISNSFGEFQVLLLDPESCIKEEFAESTINLQDLQ